MTTETLMWLLPIVFMIHDFEEIIFFKSWGEKKQAVLAQRIPGFLLRIQQQTLSLSTAAFAFAVAGLFVALSLFTYLCIQYQWITLWAVMTMLFFVHLIFHIVSAIVARMIIPALVTSIPASVYSIFALNQIRSHPLFDPSQIWLAAIICITGAGLVVSISIRAARVLDQHLS